MERLHPMDRSGKSLGGDSADVSRGRGARVVNGGHELLDPLEQRLGVDHVSVNVEHLYLLGSTGDCVHRTAVIVPSAVPSPGPQGACQGPRAVAAPLRGVPRPFCRLSDCRARTVAATVRSRPAPSSNHPLASRPP